VSDSGAEVRALVRKALVLDGHNDLALRVIRGDDPAGRLEGGHLDLPRMREGGFDGGIFAVWIDPSEEDPLGRTLAGLEALLAWAERTPEIRLVGRASDLEAAREAGEVAVVPGVEGGYGIDRDLTALDRMHAAGARCLTLTWMRPTSWADASGVDPVHGGLTSFGRRVVERARTLGMAVDVSHASDETALAALDVAGGGVLASHSGAQAVADHHRNLPDGLIEAVADAGGVIGVVFFPAYLDEDYARAFGALRRELGADLASHEGRQAFDRAVRERLEPPSLSCIAEHAERIRAVAGPEAVALGSDFDGTPSLPRGMRDVRDLPELAASLADRGWGMSDLTALLGENLRRFLVGALEGA
jgi:membrane dipeptidase